MNNNKDTSFVFDGDKIIISPDLWPIVDFIQNIEKEIDFILGFEERLESIRKQYAETIELIRVLAQKIQENSIDFSFVLSENPSTFTDKLKIDYPLRSKMIILFAHMETLRCFNIAYENKVSEDKEIRKIARENIIPFIRDFCLSNNNDWVKNNQERANKITPDYLWKLRCSLTHFFSVTKDMAIADKNLEEKSRRLEIFSAFNIKFISPEDLNEIIKGAGKITIKRWVSDYKENPEEFKERILFVKSIVEKNGAILIRNKEINI